MQPKGVSLGTKLCHLGGEVMQVKEKKPLFLPFSMHPGSDFSVGPSPLDSWTPKKVLLSMRDCQINIL